MKYKIKLFNTCDGESLDCELETTKTLKSFKKAYYEIRDDWFKENYADSLFEYLVEKLEKRGYILYESDSHCDLKLDF